MSQAQEDTDNTSSDLPGASVLSEARKRSLANLRPAWRPGQSGNPSGLSAEGLPSKEAALQRHAERLLAHPNAKGQTWAYRIVKRWITDAAAGSDAARRDLLDRFYPVPKDDQTSGRIILEGLKLELSPGKATLTTVSTSTSTDGALVGGQSDARMIDKESYGGGQQELLPMGTPPEVLSSLPLGSTYNQGVELGGCAPSTLTGSVLDVGGLGGSEGSATVGSVEMRQPEGVEPPAGPS